MAVAAPKRDGAENTTGTEARPGVAFPFDIIMRKLCGREAYHLPKSRAEDLLFLVDDIAGLTDIQANW